MAELPHVAELPRLMPKCLATSGRADDIVLSFSKTHLLELLPLTVRVLPLKGTIPSKNPSQMSPSVTGSTCPCSFVILCCHESTCHTLPQLHTEDGEFLGGEDGVFYLCTQKEPALLKYSATL